MLNALAHIPPNPYAKTPVGRHARILPAVRIRPFARLGGTKLTPASWDTHIIRRDETRVPLGEFGERPYVKRLAHKATHVADVIQLGGKLALGVDND